mgnify:CR=1 FL=1
MKQKTTQSNSYLTFKLGEEEFGAHVSQVINILEMSNLTTIPKSPDYMKGIINLRGMVLPVIDARIKLGMEEASYTYKTCIIVMDLELDNEEIQVGMIVDEVISVIEMNPKQLQEAPEFGNKQNARFLKHIANVEDQFIQLIDMNKLLNSEELSDIKTNTKEQEHTLA